MDFKSLFSNRLAVPSLLVILVVGVVFWKFIPKADSSIPDEVSPSPQIEAIKDISVRPAFQNLPVERVLTRAPGLDISTEDDAAIQQQLDRDREEQKQTKYLKTKLEQTNLELEQEKALAEINKLKMENAGTFKEPALEGQRDLPEIKVEYIGGDSVKKEAILSIAGTSFQVKEKSTPTDDIQVVSISDSSVTLHFNAPQVLTKSFDYKPE